jgi:hypothetical protein
VAGTIRIAILANAARARSEIQSVASTAQQTEGKLSKLSGLLKGALAGAAVAGGLAVGKALVDSTKRASDLNETLNKSRTIFGAQAGAMEQWAGSAAKSAGLSRSAALEASAGFGDMFQQIGLTAAASAKLSRETVQMAADFGSFNNLETGDVLDRISAAYRGEFDSLQSLIPNINAARVEQEALTLSGKKSTKQLTAQDKALAVNAILHKDGARAMGDFAKTSDGAANKQKILKARLEDLSAKVGQKLLPVFDKLLDIGEGVLDFFEGAGKEGSTAGKVFGAVKSAAGGFFDALRKAKDTVMPAIRNAIRSVSDALNDHQGAVNFVLGVVKLWGTYITKVVIPVIAKWVSLIVKLWAPAIRVIATVIEKVVIPAVKALLSTFTTVIGGILRTAAGIAEKLHLPFAKELRAASNEFDKLARNAKAALNGIPSKKTINVVALVNGKQQTIQRAIGSANDRESRGISFGGARARGGPVRLGRAYLVGERGPELFVPGASGTIVPNGSGGGAGVQDVNVTFGFDAANSGDALMDVIVNRLRARVRAGGGNVQAVLGGR